MLDYIDIDNIDIAILMKVNELAARYGLKPRDFVANLLSDDDKTAPRHEILAFETVPETPDLKRKHIAMLDALGANPLAELKGSREDILDALDNAIARAPKPRSK